MSLVDPTGRVSPEALKVIYRELREGILELKTRLDADPGSIVDAARWRSASDLATDLLRLLPANPDEIRSDRLADHVNGSYATLVVLVDLVKLAYGLPRVPQARA
jgi:hypothetical protein